MVWLAIAYLAGFGALVEALARAPVIEWMD